MRVLFLSGRELEYQRNAVILRAFQRLGTVKVISPKSQPRSLIWSSIVIALRAMPSLILKNYDLVFVGFFGHLLVFPVKLLSSAAILFDAFVSVSDTLTGDRKVITRDSMSGKLAYWLDSNACRLADLVLLDTQQHLEYFLAAFDLPEFKFSALPVGCNEDLFYPRTSPKIHSKSQVFYYSTYQPLHGVGTVVQAAHRLREEADIAIKIIGAGQEYPQVRRLAEELDVNNVSFEAPVSIEQLPHEIASADICLGGHFGSSEKADRVIPGKIYQLLAMERALIATETTANRDLLTHEETAYLIPPSDPEALARAILILHKDIELRQRLAEAGRKLFMERCSEGVIAERLAQIIQVMPRRQ